MTTIDYKLLVLEKLNKFRALLRIIESPEFHECLTLNPNDHYIKSKIENGDIDSIKKWLRSKLRSEVTDYSARQLRHLAIGLGIKGYCSKTKSTLLAEIISIKRAKALKIILELVPAEQGDLNGVLD